ncbi:GDSL-type esterase/lipase family protein [Neotabrizicola sp. sgz301269]|uniref:GDSL-type esterase/lipase family protein n=1 Tax=Neotabrizicola sp. sgz301269 TaxID=3276282 RepID=UPI00376FBB44
MRIGIGIGLGAPADVAGTSAPETGPTLSLALSPASPGPGDLVTLTGIAGGTPLATDFASLTATIGGTALQLAGAGLVRSFVARPGALALSASITTSAGTAGASLSGSVAAGPSATSVIGFGSSTMEGDNASVAAARALDLIAATLGAGTIRNKGLSGTVLQNSPDASLAPRADNGRDRFAADLLGANRSARLYLLYGANDLRYTGAPATFNLAGFATDMREVLNGLLMGGYSRDQIILGSPNWYPDATYSVGSTGFTGSNRTIHESYVAECGFIAAEYGLAYADVYAKMRDLGGTALMSADGLHCNDAGHQVIAHAFLTAAPNNLRATVIPGTASGGVGILTLAWTATSGATGYEVEYGIAGSYAYGNRQTVTVTSASATGVAAGSYYARVRAVFADGTGPWSFWPAALVVTASGGGDVVTGQQAFTGTSGALLTDLTPALGAWSRHSLSTGQASIASTGDALRGPGTTSQFIVGTIDDEVLATKVFVEMDVLIRSNSAQLTSYAVARCAADSLTFLAAGYNGSAWRILKYVAGATTVLGTYSLTEAIGATPVLRFEVEAGAQRLYRNGVLLLTTTEPDSGLGILGNGLGLRLGAGSTAWTSTTGAQVTAIRVGRGA